MDLKLMRGDITGLTVDAIVNAANSSLLGGGGVDGAIHRKGGRAILDECIQIRNRQGGCPPGEAVYTTAGLLPARYVIHTVGPVWSGGHHNEQAILRRCYINSLKLADSLGVQSIAFPNISTGIYQFPKADAARIALEAVADYEADALNTPIGIDTVLFVCFDEENYTLYAERLR